jgi:acetolactate decarboxylase
MVRHKRLCALFHRSGFSKRMLFFILIVFTSACAPSEKRPDNAVKVAGAMRSVMWKGQLNSTILLDTIAEKTHLYGLGPAEYLTGELMIIDGRSYRSFLRQDSVMSVEETYNTGAPFFVYAHINEWIEHQLPDSIRSIQQLDDYLDATTRDAIRPFAFRLTGTIESATIHVVNLPKGSTINSPAEAHQGQRNFVISNEPCDIIGFFSTSHKSVFTHHDSNVHMHLITADKQKMGHVDKLTFTKGTARLYLPTK